ncbi:MAG: response regulator transcription factor, partial [Deltaproteobacteria bacterium]|nr:response regulator transcription factor [Deltaproteobacteria bacterium]
QIASALKVSVKTVETHKLQLMNKLGVRNIAELTKFALREGLTSLEN